MKIKGRPNTLVGKIEGTVIRIDNPRYLPFWAEIHLTRKEVEELHRNILKEEPIND